MKKLGIMLLLTVLYVGVFAKTESQPMTSDSTKMIAHNDSLEKLYMNDNLDPKEAILLQKLTAEQLMELEKQRLEKDKMDNMPFDKFGLLLISIAPFVLVILIVFIATNFKNKESVRKHELFTKAIEAGQAIPESYFKEQEKPKTSNLQKGAIWLGVGLALVIASFVTNSNLFTLGIIPAFIGVAFLLVYFIEKPKKSSSEL